jgi:hypothetical protein
MIFLNPMSALSVGYDFPFKGIRSKESSLILPIPRGPFLWMSKLSQDWEGSYGTCIAAVDQLWVDL